MIYFTYYHGARYELTPEEYNKLQADNTKYLEDPKQWCKLTFAYAVQDNPTKKDDILFRLTVDKEYRNSTSARIMGKLVEDMTDNEKAVFIGALAEQNELRKKGIEI